MVSKQASLRDSVKSIKNRSRKMSVGIEYSEVRIVN